MTRAAARSSDRAVQQRKQFVHGREALTGPGRSAARGRAGVVTSGRTGTKQAGQSPDGVATARTSGFHNVRAHHPRINDPECTRPGAARERPAAPQHAVRCAHGARSVALTPLTHGVCVTESCAASVRVRIASLHGGARWSLQPDPSAAASRQLYASRKLAEPRVRPIQKRALALRNGRAS